MINSQEPQEENVPTSPPAGAAVLAGIATAIVIAMWFAFYLLVFMPRATSP
jgi:hypothetical protein